MKKFEFKSIHLTQPYSKIVAPSASTQKLLTQPTQAVTRMITSTVSISNSKLEEALLIYQWRSKTEFPIIKVQDTKVLSQNKGRSLIEISMENFPLRLNELTELPLFKILYLLKESIIGFERLYDKFGPFPITPLMIVLNSQNKCKVWLNEAFQSNEFANIPVSEAVIVRLIVKMIAESSNKLKSTVHFFGEILKLETFCQVLNFVDSYAKHYKISIPGSCRVLPKEMVVKSNVFNPNLSMNKAPKFVPNASLRASLKASSSHALLNFKESSKMIQNQEDEREKRSKKSGQTAVDIDQSMTFSGSNNQERYKIQQSHIFGKNQDNRNLVFQSGEVPKKGFFQKNSEQNSSQQKMQFTSQYFKTESKPSFLSRSKDTQVRKFGQIRDEQNEEQIRMKQEELYTKNNWEKSINGLLFSQQSNLKSSIQLSKDEVSTKDKLIKLQFLDKLGKQMCQSQIHEQSPKSFELEWNPSTSQF